MRFRVLVLAIIAVGFAAASAYMVRTYMDEHSGKTRVVEVKTKSTSIVVASEPLRYGTKLTGKVLREIDWPAGNVPAGAFTTVSDLLSSDKERFVLSALEPNEPVLEQKITGPGQRATLSAVVGEGMRAITVRVNDVFGVAGFVLPGEKVDVLVTGQQNQSHFVDVLVQNVRVLAVDQIADDRTTNPVVAKAVTLEVSAEQSQKIALGSAIGHISLVLRHAGTGKDDKTHRLTVADLQSGSDGTGKKAAPAVTKPAAGPNAMATVGIRRGMERKEYSVSRYATMN